MTSIQVDVLERRVAADPRYWPNGPSAEDYARNAEELGHKVQPICDSAGSFGAYYTVFAVYEAGSTVLGREPLCLIFEDFSQAAESVWVVSP
jgi:hypothetical protein